ncbi:MAG TPA: efflux RND transporter periplasmic adaptor subunit, partial [Hyphomicrobiaceae bacterium]|nr:efflux RND transporter periplasmic adaptor subunit [Hyphomicrobiaceae bacterium]
PAPVSSPAPAKVPPAASVPAPSGPATTAAPGAAKPAPPPPVVTVSRPAIDEVVEWDEYTARFDAVEMVEVRPRVSGYLTEVAFKDGQLVKKGDLLFVIDPRPFERALEATKAELELAKTRAENAGRDVERGRPLVERKIMSEKVFDDRANAHREAEAQVKVATARMKIAELDLSFTRITAPVAGRIGRALLSPGAYIAGGGAQNTPVLTTIVSQDPIHLYFDVSENNYLKYKRLGQKGAKAGASEVGSAVLVAMPDERDFRHKGLLDFIDNRLDTGTGTLRARAVLENGAALFSPGMFARVRVAGSPRYSAMLLPDSAISSDQASKFVLVVADDGTVSRKPVQLGPIYNGLRIIKVGIGNEDWIVVNGLQRARPGSKVTPKREPIKVSEAPAPAAPAPAKQP